MIVRTRHEVRISTVWVSSCVLYHFLAQRWKLCKILAISSVTKTKLKNKGGLGRTWAIEHLRLILVLRKQTRTLLVKVFEPHRHWPWTCWEWSFLGILLGWFFFKRAKGKESLKMAALIASHKTLRTECYVYLWQTKPKHSLLCVHSVCFNWSKNKRKKGKTKKRPGVLLSMPCGPQSPDLQFTVRNSSK